MGIYMSALNEAQEWRSGASILASIDQSTIAEGCEPFTSFTDRRGKRFYGAVPGVKHNEDVCFSDGIDTSLM